MSGITRQPSPATESRLDELRRRGAAGDVHPGGIVPPGAPFPRAAPANGYYGLPLLKKPVWTWEIPLYFFVGGTGGAAAIIAEISRLNGDHRVSQDARLVAAAGAALSAPLLIADLGRPERFLHMLRVFKPQSPMSIGVWIVLCFSSAAGAAVAADVMARGRPGRSFLRLASTAAGTTSAAAGLGMATYTGVLIAATAIPVWSDNVRLLPVHFAFSALGAAASILQLRHPRHRALHRLGLAAALMETGIGAGLELLHGRVNDPLRRGASGWLMRSAGLLSGPLPLLLRALGGRSRGAVRAAAIAATAGSLLTRYGWIAAGRSSASDPREPLRLPPEARRTAPADVVPSPISRTQAPLTVAGTQSG